MVPTDLQDDEDVIEPFDPDAESFADRLYALRDIVPPLTRARISKHASRAVTYGKTGGRWAFSTMWVVTTSALLVVLPAMLALEGEALIAQQEREFQQQQAGAAQMTGATNELLPPGM